MTELLATELPPPAVNSKCPTKPPVDTKAPTNPAPGMPAKEGVPMIPPEQSPYFGLSSCVRETLASLLEEEALLP